MWKLFMTLLTQTGSHLLCYLICLSHFPNTCLIFWLPCTQFLSLAWVQKFLNKSVSQTAIHGGLGVWHSDRAPPCPRLQGLLFSTGKWERIWDLLSMAKKKKNPSSCTISYQLVSDNLSCFNFYHSFLMNISWPIYHQPLQEPFKIFSKFSPMTI